MRRGRPLRPAQGGAQGQVAENLLDHCGLFNEGFVASVSTELDEVSAERR